MNDDAYKVRVEFDVYAIVILMNATLPMVDDTIDGKLIGVEVEVNNDENPLAAPLPAARINRPSWWARWWAGWWQ